MKSTAFAWLFGASMLASLPGQTVFQVTNPGDAGTATAPAAGTLRWAFRQVVASPAGAAAYTIEVTAAALASNIVLQAANGPLSTIPAGRSVHLRPLATAGRLVLDATAVVGPGMVFNSAGCRLEMPLRILVDQGTGLIVNGNGMQVDDLEVQATPASPQGVVANGTSGFVAHRLAIVGGQTGLLLQGATNAQIAAAPGDPRFDVSGCTGQGVVANGGSGHVFRSLRCANNGVGMRLSSNCSNVTLGDPAAPRSLFTGNASHGLEAVAFGNAGAPLLRNADLTDNGGYGLLLNNCSQLNVRDLLAARNALGGILLDQGCTAIGVGPAADTTGPVSGNDTGGLIVRAATTVDVVGCTFGPGHATGMLVNRGGSAATPTGVTFTACVARGCRKGADVRHASQVVLDGCTLEDNAEFGLTTVGTPATPTANVTVRNATLQRNGQLGLDARAVGSLVFGPGNLVAQNGQAMPAGLQYGGCVLADCQGLVFGVASGAPAPAVGNRILDNVGIGLDLIRCHGATTSHTDVLRTVGEGMRVTNTANPTVGPRVTIENNFDVGLRIDDQSSAVVVQRTTLRANAGYGMIAANLNGLSFGPDNQVEQNFGVGCLIQSCSAVAFAGDQTQNLRNGVRHNGGPGLDVRYSPGFQLRDTDFEGNAGFGLWLSLNSNDAVVGPGVVVTGVAGTGISVESAGNVLVQGCRISGCTSGGLQFLADPNPVQPSRVQSCVIADNPGIGLRLQHGPQVTVQLCTIAHNYRGVHSSQQWNGQTSVIDVDSCLVWGNVVEDLGAGLGGAVQARWSFFRLPAPVGNNNRGLLPADDPQFTNPGGGIYRLQPTSPAIDSCNPALPLPLTALDAFGRPRLVGVRADCGAFEWSTNPQPAPPVLSLHQYVMPAGGGDLGFTLRYPAADAGALSLVLLEIGRPSGSFVVAGASIPLGLNPFLLQLVQDPRHQGTLAVVPPAGVFSGLIRWGGYLPNWLQGQEFSVCAVSLDPSGWVRTVSVPETFVVP